MSKMHKSIQNLSLITYAQMGTNISDDIHRPIKHFLMNLNLLLAVFGAATADASIRCTCLTELGDFILGRYWCPAPILCRRLKCPHHSIAIRMCVKERGGRVALCTCVGLRRGRVAPTFDTSIDFDRANETTIDPEK
jgi:hypothetical protein